MAQPLPGASGLARALLAAGVDDPRVLAAFARVDRGRFVPPGAKLEAAADRPIPIGHRQVTTQPSLIGRMVQALRLGGDERVLEIGTGYGYQTAILAELAGEVHSVERFGELAGVARANLGAAGYDVEVVVDDGTLGHPTRAPYHAIVVSAAAPDVPPPLIAQLAEGGRLVMPMGRGGDEEVISFRKEDGQLISVERLCHAYFVPLVGRHGADRREDAAG